MDFNHALHAQLSLSKKLSAYIRTPDGSLDADKVCDDRNCALAKWLQANSKMFSPYAEYQSLLEEHARFHTIAAYLVSKANAGEKMDVEAALGFYSAFRAASRNVIREIAALKKNVAAIARRKMPMIAAAQPHSVRYCEARVHLPTRVRQVDLDLRALGWHFCC